MHNETAIVLDTRLPPTLGTPPHLVASFRLRDRTDGVQQFLGLHRLGEPIDRAGELQRSTLIFFTRGLRPKPGMLWLLANAEAAEDLVQDVFGVDGADNHTQRVQGIAQIGGD